MEAKIKTNHPFTVKQLKTLNSELKKISTVQISLKGIAIPSKINYADIQILKSPFLLDVFLSFIDVTIPEQPKFNTYKIDTLGKIDYEVKKNMHFHSLADRVSFFNQLEPIEFTN
jgi:hypothetical protein